MNSIVKDVSAFEQLKALPHYEALTRFDDSGKTRFFRAVYNVMIKKGDFSQLGKNESEFATFLGKAINTSGVMACLDVLQGTRTYSWRPGCSPTDIIEEANKIRNGTHEGNPETFLMENPEYYDIIRESYDIKFD
ncbi:MAG: hypothetical protein JW700_03170 [Candidatus Aenigmarchaeota archaeon]|nr:hypothetical protein [Candidatus Aenigmarchaeota archaeon]